MAKNEELTKKLEEMGIEVKTIDGWQKFSDENNKHDWNDYCKPGDYVDDGVFNYFLDILPPHAMSKTYLQVGEPHESRMDPNTGKFRSTYATFAAVEEEGFSGIWMYCGNCFTGRDYDAGIYRSYDSIREYLEATYRCSVSKDVILRPRVICKDGFRMSVQASKYHYCNPRENLEDGRYQTCEVGRLSRKEELLAPYAEDSSKLTKTIYAQVPVEVIDQVIQEHGGFFDNRMPVV